MGQSLLSNPELLLAVSALSEYLLDQPDSEKVATVSEISDWLACQGYETSAISQFFLTNPYDEPSWIDPVLLSNLYNSAT